MAWNGSAMQGPLPLHDPIAIAPRLPGHDFRLGLPAVSQPESPAAGLPLTGVSKRLGLVNPHVTPIVYASPRNPGGRARSGASGRRLTGPYSFAPTPGLSVTIPCAWRAANGGGEIMSRGNNSCFAPLRRFERGPCDRPRRECRDERCLGSTWQA